jgi:hypothetical protein
MNAEEDLDHLIDQRVSREKQFLPAMTRSQLAWLLPGCLSNFRSLLFHPSLLTAWNSPFVLVRT